MSRLSVKRPALCQRLNNYHFREHWKEFSQLKIAQKNSGIEGMIAFEPVKSEKFDYSRVLILVPEGLEVYQGREGIYEEAKKYKNGEVLFASARKEGYSPAYITPLVSIDGRLNPQSDLIHLLTLPWYDVKEGFIIWKRIMHNKRNVFKGLKPSNEKHPILL